MQPEEQLINDLRLGSNDAFAELYQQYKQAVYFFCLKLCADRMLAEDAAHDTFLRVRDHITTLHDNALFKSWMYAIARNSSFKLIAQTRRNGTLDEELVWSDSSPLAELEAEDQAVIVRRCITHLKVEYREVIHLREYENLSYEEIARITGDTESSVKSRLFKARKALGEQLKPYFKERGDR